MQIELNGERREIADGTSLNEFVTALSLAPERIAIELNREVVRRPVWEDTPLRDGDHVEIVHFVGGG